MTTTTLLTVSTLSVVAGLFVLMAVWSQLTSGEMFTLLAASFVVPVAAPVFWVVALVVAHKRAGRNNTENGDTSGSDDSLYLP